MILPDLPIEPCRLCGGEASYIFSKIVLSRHRVGYYKCSACGSQQTQTPTWLEEAYSFPGMHIDVGAPTRAIKNWLAVATLLDAMEIAVPARCIDFGAGSGLFSALMRSIGRDFWSFDRFNSPLFSSYYYLGDLVDEEPAVITAFEVFEHLPDPAITLDFLFSRGALLILFTTWLVDGQDPEWIYYLPDCGQHVFFYSRKGIEDMATKHGYSLCVSQYFYILYAEDRLLKDQVQAVRVFAFNAIAQVAAAIPERITQVFMGNAHIDLDFTDSSITFLSRLSQSVDEREQRFGLPL